MYNMMNNRVSNLQYEINQLYEQTRILETNLNYINSQIIQFKAMYSQSANYELHNEIRRLENEARVLTSQISRNYNKLNSLQRRLNEEAFKMQLKATGYYTGRRY